MRYCEDYPACGHTPQDPCDPRNAITEPWWCDICGFNHHTECPVETR